jgi:hypothetical protein
MGALPLSPVKAQIAAENRHASENFSLPLLQLRQDVSYRRW